MTEKFNYQQNKHRFTLKKSLGQD